MLFNSLKNSDKYHWTEHAKFKMKFYGLSPQRVLRVIRAPERIEEGIVEKTIAVMQPASTRMKNGKKVWSQEIWAMYQSRLGGTISKSPACQSLALAGRQIPNPKKIKNSKDIQNTKYMIHNTAKQQLRIISAWRYPGMSPKKDPIPEEILREIEEII